VLVESVLCLLAFVFSADVKRKVVEILQMEALVHYRDDDDLRNLIDWTQHTVRLSVCLSELRTFCSKRSVGLYTKRRS